MRPRTHQWIDERSLALARATADKLRGDASLFAVVEANLARWKSTIVPWPEALREWEALLGPGAEAALNQLLDESPRGRRLRQSSPFVGVLSIGERNAIFREYESQSESESS